MHLFILSHEIFRLLKEESLKTIISRIFKESRPKSFKSLFSLIFFFSNIFSKFFIKTFFFILNYPEHLFAARAQYKKAEIYLNDIKDYDFAIQEYERVVRQYPNHEVAKNSLFMIAYIYNNYLNSYTDAIDNYNLFINKYPDDELIPSVQFELEGLFEIEVIIDSLNSIVSQKRNL